MGGLFHAAFQEASLLVSCCAVFMAIYAFAFLALFRGWKGIARHEASSCAMSVVHGSFATVCTAYDICRSPWKLDAPNTAYQAMVMDFSTAYFLVDLVHYALFDPRQTLFVLHHVASTAYMLSCRYFTGHGAVSIMALLGLAECTGPLQNIRRITSLAASGGSACARRAHNSMNLVFLTYFSIVRGILGPWLTVYLCRFYLTGQADTVIPRWLACYWMCTIILTLSGSLFWVSSLWARWREERDFASGKIE